MPCKLLKSNFLKLCYLGEKYHLLIIPNILQQSHLNPNFYIHSLIVLIGISNKKGKESMKLGERLGGSFREVGGRQW